MSLPVALFQCDFSELGSRSCLEPLWRNLEQRAKPNFFLSWHWIGSWLAEVDVAPWLLTVRKQKTDRWSSSR